MTASRSQPPNYGQPKSQTKNETTTERHADDGDPYRCTVSSVGYPNDNYEGGELFFKLFNIKYKPTAGDFVICPSAYSYAHSSEPVTNDGIKYSFVIMSDRNEFAHRADSPAYHPESIRKKYGV